MAIDKKINYEMQGGVRNYKPSQMVTAPKTAKSSPKHPTAHLAYITNKEKDLLIKKNLYGSLKGKPNRGPAGIPSLQGDFGPGGTGGSYGGHEGPDRSGTKDRGTGNYAVSNKAVQNEYNKNRAIREANERAVDKLHGRDTRLSGGINTTSRFGGLGGLLRGALGIFGGIPGKLLSGVISAKNWAKNKAVGLGDEAEEFGNYPTLDRYLNRNTQKYKDKPYLGQGKSNYSFDGPTLGNNLGLAVNRQKAPIGPGLRVGEDQGYYGMGSQYDPNRFQNTNITGGTDFNDFQGVNFNDTITPLAKPVDNTIDENDPMYFNAMAKDGGRIGYQNGELVEQETDFIQGPQGGEEFQETVVEGQEQPSREQLEALAMEIFQLPLEQLDEQQLLVVYQEAMQGQPMEEAVQEEDVQFAANGGLAGLL